MGSKRKQESSQRQNNVQNSKRKAFKKADEGEPERSNKFLLFYYLVVIALAITISVTHRSHIARLFESDRHFSHLSTLERELAFRTEMGLYYSYFKTIIQAPTFSDGLASVMYDNITEYPLTINVLKRFNLYPEVVLAAGYRIFEATNAWMKRPTKMCWTVNRGEGYGPVQSCEGLGEPSYFYTEAAFTLHGLMMGMFFLFGTYLSGSVFGGILTVASYFYNHGECTRVQWTPPLRESFAYPFFVLQMFIVTYVLKTDRLHYIQSIFIAIATISFMLPWQFAQFALMTQTVAVFGTYVLGFIGFNRIKVVLLGQSIGLLVSYVFLFGNEMLLTSFFASCLCTVWIIVILEPVIEQIKIRVAIWGIQGVLLAVGTVGLKFLIAKVLQVADDAHIGEIFKSKFTDFKNFHTMLYTCAAEFDFMESETPWRLLKTLLSPSVAAVVMVTTFTLLRREYQMWKKSDTKENGQPSMGVIHTGPDRSKPGAEVVYHLFQLIAFTTMAVLIMRLKLFWTPHLCLLASLLASRQYFGWIGRKEIHYSVIAVILGGMSVQGYWNLQQQWSIMGEFSNYPLEELVEWIKARTPKNAVFAGPMPTMATIKLCTLRPIVNHPHYEDAGLRERTKKVYTMYSRKPLEVVKQNLLDLKVDYAILEDSWCHRRSKPGCGMAEIWDLEDEENRHNGVPACTLLKQKPEPHFKRVFRNSVYDVLKISA